MKCCPATFVPATGSSGSRVPDCGATATRWRAALLDRAGMALDGPAWPGWHQTLADVLLEPSVIYAPAMLELARKVPVHAFAHVTGGGIPGNLVRVLPERCDGVVWRGTWEEPRIFAEIQRAGDVPDDEMQQVFNLGVGMLALVPGDVAERARRGAFGGHDAWIVGEVVDGHGRVHVETR